jgi:CRISPR-associated endonuclease/helicase Cas3
MPEPNSELAEFFRSNFFALTDYSPYPWQESLFLFMVEGEQWNKLRNISLPTGTGKTAIMAIWLLALVWEAAHAENAQGISIPRRLIWIVNRRVVVDQATKEAEQLSLRINNKEKPFELAEVREALTQLSSNGSGDRLLAISTLRGQFADNAEWRNDPARPAIAVGTVDMIGSRLLFSGYGRGFKSRPLHAAFLAQDALLVHDEAHLEPAFQKLIEAIESEQERFHEFRSFRLMALTATSRGDGDEPFTLTAADLNQEDIRKIIEARKGISFVSVKDESHVAEEVYRRALEFKDSGQAILVFLRKLKDVETVADKLNKMKLSVQRLTGTMRGLERDDLAKTDRIFARFMREPGVEPRAGVVFLVCTSAGEVGINISADHLICDLTPYDSMAQRLGRVNRFGGGDARIVVVFGGDQDQERQTDKKKKGNPRFDQVCEQTRLQLQNLPNRPDERHDASPAALVELLKGLPPAGREAIFSPAPVILPATDILFDAWALTSIRGKLPGRPPVADWLHGISEWEPPETYVAWREEVEVIRLELQSTYKPEDLLEDYPLKPHELLRDTTERVFSGLAKIAERSPELHAWVVASDGNVRPLSLAELVNEGKDSLADSLVLLPPQAGGLDKGMFNGGKPFDEASRADYDVADRWMDEKETARRCRVWDNPTAPPGMRLVRSIHIAPITEDDLDEEEQSSARRWRWYVRPKSADDDGSRAARTRQELNRHLELAGHFADALATKLISQPDEARAVGLAAKWHDLGKHRSLWQRSIGNRDPSVWLAKSGDRDQPTEITGYRHEFGSILDVWNEPEFLELAPAQKELVLHLIAAHHGRARPHFCADEAFDPDSSEKDAVEIARGVPGRYARLQRKYGRWGLAYLESLVRTADALASQSGDADEKPVDLAPTVIPGGRTTSRAMSQVRESVIRLRVDVKNPGEFFACCGVLELADRLWGEAEGWFRDGTFSVATSGTLYDLLAALNKDPAIEMTRLDNGLSVKALIAPLQLRLTPSIRFTLDAWMTIRRDKSEVAALANRPWNFWSGQQTSFGIWKKLCEALEAQMKELTMDGQDAEGLFSHRDLLSGRFGFDPGAAWKALDVGFSPDTQQIRVASSPAAELLAAVGLQRFRPRLSDDRSSFYYATWGQPLAPSVASAAASGIVSVFPAMHFRGKIIDRGNYSALGYSTVLNGAHNG